jgi:hypothetical protein
MENTAVKAEPHIIMNNTVQSTSRSGFDLPVLTERLKSSRTWALGELSAKILLKSACKQILLTALHAGTEIKSFQSGESLSLQIIEGSLKFHSDKESVTLEKGQLLTIYEKVDYCLTCAEDTVFLLTIANNSASPPKN